MKQPMRRGVAFLIPAIFLILLFTVAGLWLQQTTTAFSADPPPALPPFEGEADTAVLVNTDELLRRSPVPFTNLQNGWTTVLSETFESGLNPTLWTSIDNDAINNGEYKWGTETYTNTTPGGTRSAWAVGAGEHGGQLDPANDGYPNSVDAWLIYGPVNMEDVIEATLTFDYWLQANAGDTFGVYASTDGTRFQGVQVVDGGAGSWASVNHSLDDYTGESNVYIGFNFSSDDSDNPQDLRGAFIDGVSLRVQPTEKSYLPAIAKAPTSTPTPTPTATPTQTPDDYFDDFDDSDTDWDIRRTNTSTSDVRYRDDEILELTIGGFDDYMIVSPLVPAPAPNYKIETEVQLRDMEESHAYGIIFGGDWNGEACLNSNNTSCFNQYYWLRVQWRENDGDPFLEYRLRRIDSHDSDNTPHGTDLISWTRLDVPHDDWNEWDIVVESDGDIKISLRDEHLETVRDDTYIDQPYFGVALQTKSIGAARAKFDYFEVETQ